MLRSDFMQGRVGAPGWNRTSDFQLRRLTSYPLDYGRLENQCCYTRLSNKIQIKFFFGFSGNV